MTLFSASARYFTISHETTRQPRAIKRFTPDSALFAAENARFEVETERFGGDDPMLKKAWCVFGGAITGLYNHLSTSPDRPMRQLLFLLPLALPFAMVQAAPPYVPKFARVQQDAQLIPCAKPDYPKAARRNEETGKTTLRYAVSPAGTVTDVAVIKSSGFRELDKAAVAAVATCRFTPASIAGKPVKAIMLAQYRWDLE